MVISYDGAMIQKDEFDDPEGFQSAFGKISRAMEQRRSGMRQRGPLIGILTVMVALFVLFAVFWSTYPRGGNDLTEAAVPVVHADASSYMKSPEEPGGMDIPYRDSTVFDPLRSAEDEGDSHVESLLPPPEEPIDREKMFAGLKTEPIDDGESAGLDAGPSPEATDITEEHRGVILSEEMPAVESNPPEKVADAKAEKEPEPENKAVKPEAVAKTEPAAGNAKEGTHYVQLVSIKDRKLADAEWKKLQKQFPSQLSSLSMRVQEADLGAKGKFYRIQGGSVSQSRAKDICSAISSQRAGGCLVVAR